jgi:hypothetical protein
MSVGDMAAVISTVLAVGAVLAAVLRMWIKQIVHEVKPNGGSSMADKINGLVVQVARLEQKLDDHLARHRKDW